MEKANRIFYIQRIILAKDGLHLTITESIILKRVIAECIRDQPLSSISDESAFTLKEEIIKRFFVEAFGIDLHSYLGILGDREEYKRKITDLACYINDHCILL